MMVRYPLVSSYSILYLYPAQAASETPAPPLTTFSKWRNILAFWLLGSMNNYPYIVMLSAALDILHSLEGGELNTVGEGNSTKLTNDSTEPYNNNSNNNNNNNSCTLLFDEATNSSGYRPRDLCLEQGTAVWLIIN